MANINGNNNDEFIPGTNDADVIDANGGNDTVNGLGGNDTIFGDGGNDLLFGNSGADSIRGGDGDDTIEGGAGADFLDGDSGRDIVSYESSDAGVRVGLNFGTGRGGHAEGDRYEGIDGFIGSSFNDRLLLNENRSNLFLSGRDGFDTLEFREFQDLRNDALFGFEDLLINDTTSGRKGFDINSTQLGAVERIRINNSTGETDIFIDTVNGVNVDLSEVEVTGFVDGDFIRIRGENNFDNIKGSSVDDEIEARGGNDRASGGAGNDTIFGNDGDDQLFGDEGNDSLRGGDGDDTLEGGAGADILDGDGGQDIVSYVNSDAAVRVSLNQGVGSGGHAEGDTYAGIDGFVGSVFNDRLILTENRSNLSLNGGNGFDTLELREFQDLRNDQLARFEDILINDTTSGRKGFDIFASQLEDVERIRINGDVEVDIAVVMDTAAEVDLSAIDFIGFDGNDIVRVIGDGTSEVMIGSTGRDSLDTGNGDDFAQGLGGNDLLDGDDGRDTLDGGAGNDTLFGDGGDDLLIGGAGADSIVGGGGEDVVSYSESNAAVTVNLATRTASGGHAEGDQINEIDGIVGSAFGDDLTGDGRGNQLFGQDGDDTITAGNGNDTVLGGDGNDTIFGGNNEDFLNGGAGNDRINGDNGNDTIIGGAGNDRIFGAAGNDAVFGGAGNDVVFGGTGVDFIDGGDGFDIASYATAGAAVRVDLSNPNAGAGDADGDTFINVEVIEGSAFNDTFLGDFFDNRFRGGEGADTLDGGFGSDAAEYFGSAAVNVDLTRAVQQGGDAEGDRLLNIENVFGSGENDSIAGDSGDNFLRGVAGNDRLSGRDGDDTLEGGSGDDTIDGGTGVDTARFDLNFADYTIVLQSNGAIRLTDPSGEIDRVANVEFFEFADGVVAASELFGSTTPSAGNDNLTGTNGNDTIDGLAGDDLIDGGAGNDQLNGSEGDDTLLGGDGADLLAGGPGNDSIDGGAGVDTAQFAAAFSAYTIAELDNGTITLTNQAGDVNSVTDVEFFVFADQTLQAADLFGSITPTEGNDNLVGTDGADGIDALGGDDTVDAGRGNDNVQGGDGNDLLIGGFGADNLQGGAGDDTLEGGFQDDVLDGGTGIDTASYAGFGGGISVNLNLSSAQNTGAGGIDTLSDIENLLGGQFNDTLTGSVGAGGDNLLEGDAGSDRLFGLGGDDTLDGGAGNDLLQGGNGADVLIGGEGREIMVGGGGADTFVFEAVSDSAVGGQRDRINDFDQGVDVIDLSAIDAVTGGSDNAFAFIGEDAFSGTAGELRQFDAPGRTVIAGDTDGDGSADFQIELLAAGLSLGESDFQL